VKRASGYDALLVGPGLTTEAGSQAFLKAMLAPGVLKLKGHEGDALRGGVIFDADALNILATLPDWPGLSPPLSILTPHPGEMSRLTGLSIEAVNSDRIAHAQRFARKWGHIVLLKGAHTVIAHPDGRTLVLPFAEPGLAKAGSGDVLAGTILAVLGQGLDPLAAAALGAYLHGFAGVLASREIGATAVTALELLEMLPHALAGLAS
jgi:NAD(P)H-hydrate epimerase